MQPSPIVEVRGETQAGFGKQQKRNKGTWIKGTWIEQKWNRTLIPKGRAVDMFLPMDAQKIEGKVAVKLRMQGFLPGLGDRARK